MFSHVVLEPSLQMTQRIEDIDSLTRQAMSTKRRIVYNIPRGGRPR